MSRWIRFRKGGTTGFGVLEEGVIVVHRGDLFDGAVPSGERVALTEVEVLTPCVPTKMVALWNNFHALAAKLGQSIPPEPLYFLKSASSFHPHAAPIRVPASYSGKVIFEGELGVVIGKRCRAVGEAEAASHIFGYTGINDVTAVELLFKDASFPQWTRAKGFDTFGVFGPVIATGLDPAALRVRTLLNGELRQDYAVADMVFPPARLVSLISQDLTLEPGDVIACGTSIGVGSMKPGSVVSVVIDGIGELTNRYGNAVA